MESNKKNKIVRNFIISTFIVLYAVVSLISTIHTIQFFELSNPRWLAISLAIAFEIGAAASLSSLIILDKINKTLVWILFIVLTGMQINGNLYYAYMHLNNFSGWSELFNLMSEDIVYQKRIISIISGAILPLVALGFIKSLVDYIKPVKKDEISEKEKEYIEGENIKNDEIIIDLSDQQELDNINIKNDEKSINENTENINLEPTEMENKSNIIKKNKSVENKTIDEKSNIKNGQSGVNENKKYFNEKVDIDPLKIRN